MLFYVCLRSKDRVATLWKHTFVVGCDLWVMMVMYRLQMAIGNDGSASDLFWSDSASLDFLVLGESPLEVLDFSS